MFVQPNPGRFGASSQENRLFWTKRRPGMTQIFCKGRGVRCEARKAEIAVCKHDSAALQCHCTTFGQAAEAKAAGGN